MKLLLKCPLEAQTVATAEGHQRALVRIPNGSKVIFLGSTPPRDDICLWVESSPPLDASGKPTAFDPEDMMVIEFAIITAGAPIPEGYTYRAPVRSPAGILFLYQLEEDKTPRILTPSFGRG